MMRISNEAIEYSSEIQFDIPKTSGGGKTSEKLPCRDPFILLYGDKYYLYKNLNNELVCMVSDNLEDWSKPVIVFEKPENFHGSKQFFWAPECHYYKGMFYIFTSVFSEPYQHRMISVYRADNPLGPFEDITGGHITPEEWDAIDGTLYVDEDEQPWMVFVHEWTCMPDKNGAMAAAKLSNDLSHFISTPIELFRARDPEWAKAGVTDGPFLYRSQDKLFMIWSNLSENGYCVAVSQSSNGKIDGEWIHSSRLLYEKGARPEFVTDGGHAMIFMDKDGKLRITLHGPNKSCEDDFEHVLIFEMIEKEGTLEIAL